MLILMNLDNRHDDEIKCSKVLLELDFFKKSVTKHLQKMPVLYRDPNNDFTIELIKESKSQYKEFIPEKKPRHLVKRPCLPPSPRDGTYCKGWGFSAYRDEWIYGRCVIKHKYKYKIGARYSRQLLTSKGLPTRYRWYGQITLQTDKANDFDDWIEFLKQEMKDSVMSVKENGLKATSNANELMAKYKDYLDGLEEEDDDDDESELIVSQSLSPVITTRKSRRKSGTSY